MTLSGTSPERARPGAPSPFRVLIVCTGNICRSPAIAALLRRAFDGTSTPITVSSAGTRAVVGSAMHPLTLATLIERGLNDERHRARQLTPGLVAGADLVLTAERVHRVAIVQADGTAVRRTFTLAEFTRLLVLDESLPFSDADPGWRRWTDAAAARRGQGTAPAPQFDDLDDPIAGRPKHHDRMVERAQSLIAEIRSVVEIPGAQTKPR